jgi:phosphatidate phosphatase APP1
MCPLSSQAYRGEQRLRKAASNAARRFGWTSVVLPHPGYGGQGRVRVLCRVLLAPARTDPAARRAVPGWRRFLTLEQAGAEVEVQAGGARRVVRSDAAGHVDAVLDVDLPPGRNEALLRVPGRDPVAAAVHVGAPGAPYGVVCDIDDTVWVTDLQRPLHAAWRTMALSDELRRPVPGMARLLTALARPGVPVVYLSTGAWNLAGPVESFLERNGFPPGGLLMTDWGLTPRGWFRDGRTHKSEALERLARDLPHLRWVLVGDTGQHDPEIYVDFARRSPGRVAAIALRQVARRAADTARESSTRTADGAPVVFAPDGEELLGLLRGHLGPLPEQ